MAVRPARIVAGRWAFAAVIAATATAAAAAPLSGDPLPRVREVGSISVQSESAPADPQSCEIRCGVERYRAVCSAIETPVCQCDYQPFARCSDPQKRKPRRR